MAPDVGVPDPPELTNRGVPSAFDGVELAGSEADLRRADLEDALRDGTWRAGFEAWADDTDLSDEAVRRLADAGVFEAFDFYWHPEDGRPAFEPPPLPDGLPDDDGNSPLDRGGVLAELRDLGEAVVDALADADLDFGAAGDEYTWGDESFGEDPDAPE